MAALKAALADFARRASGQDINAAADLACEVIAGHTARITARADQNKARADHWEKVAAELDVHVNLLLGFAIAGLPDTP